MNWVEVFAWIRQHDPRGYLTYVQHEILRSALARDDVQTAKKHLRDWKIPHDAR